MSKSPFGIAVILMVTVLSGVALARGGGHGGGGGGGHGGGGHFGGGHFGGRGGGGMHFGGGHFGGAHFGGHGFGRAHFGGGHFGGGRHGGPRFAARRSFSSAGVRHGANFGQFHNAALRSASTRGMLNSLSRSGSLRGGRLLASPAARTQLVAAAALAGWHGGFGAGGWWRHPGGGYGWVGPLFWPFAYYDIYDYLIWGDPVFWGYGYPDIYAGIFAPYGYDGLAGYLPPQSRGRRHARGIRIDQLCGNDSRDIAGVPVDQIAAAVQPTETQAAALDELGNASIQAAQLIRNACPTQVAATAPGRLAAMQQRIEAMGNAVALVQPALDKFYGLLTDEQKERFNALAEDQRKKVAANNGGASLVESCGVSPGAFEWPRSEIEAKLHPNDTQRAALDALQDTSAKASDSLKAACQPDDIRTPPARLAAIRKRLEAMLGAVKSVRAALDDFYATLTDEQKAQFEAIGPRRTS